MRNKWFYIALILWFSIYLHSYIKYIFLLLGILIYAYRFKDKSIIVLILVLSINNINFTCYTKTLSDSYKVVKITPYSTIVKDGFKYFKTKKLNVGLDDVINIKGQIEDLDNDYYFYGFSSKDYYSQNFIYQSIEVENYEIIKKGKSIRRKLYDLVLEKDDDISSFYKAIIFHYNDDYLSINDNIETFIYATGLYLSTLIKIFKRVLGYFIYEDILDYLSIFGLFIWGYNTQFNCTIIRLMLKPLLNKIDNKQDKVGINILILLLINNHFAYNLAFLIPISFQILLLTKEKIDFISQFFLIAIIQLSINFKMNILNSFIYPLLKNIFVFIYFSCYICLLLNLKIIPRFYIWLITLFKDYRFLQITGKPNIIILVFMIINLIYYQTNKSKRNFLILCLLLIFNQYQGLLNPFSNIVFLNVNHGDCVIYQNRFSLDCLMIDTANTFYYKRVTNYLNAKGIKTIGKLIITHEDSDHSANLTSLIDDFKVEDVIQEENEFLDYRDIRLIGLNSDKYYDDINSNSLVFYTKINGLNYLFMADATIEKEEDILVKYPNLKCDVIKIGHHGSNTSTSLNLLKKTLPKVAIISCGNYDYYHHPSFEVLEKLKAFNTYKFTTSEDGDIKIYSFFNTNLLINAKGQYAIIKGRQ